MSDLRKYKIASHRPTVVTPVALISATMESQRYHIHQIYCTNTINGNRIFNLYLGKEGSYTDHNILISDMTLAAYELFVMDMDVYLNVGEALAVETAAANSICFTVFGQLETQRGGRFTS